WVPLEGGEYEVVVTLWNSDRTTKYDVKRKKIIVGPSTKKDEEPEVSPKPSVVPSDKPVVRPSIEETPSEAPQETIESKDFFSSIDLPIVLFSVGLLVVLSVIGFAVYTMRK
ncbi:MAG: hypothetical protein QXD98_01970, partial [Candidatus Diapherotrites archaeon]